MQPHNIMVVEDEERISLYIQDTLKEFGYQIAASAVSGEEALTKVTIKKPDLILMDYKLKGKLNGVQTAKLIRQKLDVPIVFLSAYSNKDTLEEIIQSEPFGYLLKPIDESVLYTSIETAITRHRLEAKLKEQAQTIRSLNADLERRVKVRTSELEVDNLKLLNQIDLRDILESELRLSLKEEKGLGEMKNRLISTVSHEFRTPLSAIISSTELLEQYSQRWSDEKKLEILGRIRQAADKLTGLIEDVLLYSRTRDGDLECNRTNLDLAAYCENLIENFQLTAGEGKILRMVEVGEKQTAYLDQKLLGYILNNLLSNAVKYSGPGGEIELRLEWHPEKVVLQVKDNGIGIPQKDQPSLFEPFHRASNVKAIGGTGFGLAIVKHSVLAHNGHIRVDSVEGSGTIFSVSLPLTSPTGQDNSLELDLEKLPQPNLDRGMQPEILPEKWWLLERIIESSHIGFIITDPGQEENPIIYVNKAFERITGYSSKEVTGRNFKFLQGADNDLEALSLIETALATGKEVSLEIRNYRKDGSLVWNEIQISPIRNAEGKIINYVIVQNDISKRKQVEGQLFYLAFHDSLTQLPNRALFLHDLERALLRRRIDGHFVGVLFLDLDHFKIVNDTLGHHVGDQLLKAVAARLKICARQEDLVSRLGGDEFTILMNDVKSVKEAIRLAARLLEAMTLPFVLDGREVFISSSIGIALSNADDKTPADLIRKVDVALYQAKNKGKACFVVYDTTIT